MREFDKNYPPMLADAARDLYARLVRVGMAVELADRVAFAHVEHLRRQWGGSELYIQKGHRYDLSLRDREIYAKFDGRNQDALCREYDITREWLYEIFRRVRAAGAAGAAGRSTGGAG